MNVTEKINTTLLNEFYINWDEIGLCMLNFFGSVTNIINMSVFLNKNLKDSVYKYMLGISFIDFVYITLVGFEIAYRCGSSCDYRFYDYSTQLYELIIIDYFTSCLALTNILIELYLSVDRLFLLSNSKFLHKKPTKLIILMFLIISLFFYMPTLFLKKIIKITGKHHTVLSNFGKSNMGKLVPGILSGIRLFFAIFFLSVVNTITFIKFRKRLFCKMSLKTINSKHTPTTVDVSREKSISSINHRRSSSLCIPNESKIIKNLTLMIILMSGLFVIGNLPWAIYYTTSFLSNVRSVEFIFIFRICLSLLVDLKIFIYFSFNRHYRQTLICNLKFLFFIIMNPKFLIKKSK